MKQKEFETRNQPLWDLYLDQLSRLEKSKSARGRSDDIDLNRFPYLYRRICSHYALAQGRGYSPRLAGRLHEWVLRGHRQLYRPKSAWFWYVLEFVWAGFPQTLRRHARLFWLATGLFYLPAVAMGAACFIDAEFIYTLLDTEQVADVEYMYDPANDTLGRSADRQADTDMAMFGFYIFNNISVGFRVFAGGILFGLGTVFLSLFNGLTIGAVAGHLTRLGYAETFYPFVSGHGAFELTAICVSGCAGLLIARALIAPGRRYRVDALRSAALDAVKLIMGAALLFLIAALIEAFWSPAPELSPTLKLVVAAVLWLSVTAYLTTAGKSHHAAE